MEQCPLKKQDGWRWTIPKTGAMKTEGLIFASEKMAKNICGEKAHEQVENVACLPGIAGKSIAMPDIHLGYGFAIGGVAAFDLEKGIISPGGVGYDINCGIRLLRTNLEKDEIAGKVSALVDSLFANIPSGVGSTGKLNLSKNEVRDVLAGGAHWAAKRGMAPASDLNHTEETGRMAGALPDRVSGRAVERGREQLGTLGSGNHFLEIQEVEQIFDEPAAKAFGLFTGQITIMIHTGSRGLGYQVCDDYIDILNRSFSQFNIALRDRQLICAPIVSREGKDYFGAMAAAANYAWANRQIITHWTRETAVKTLSIGLDKLGLELVYDVAHNIAKFEEHSVKSGQLTADSGQKKQLLVHRKGATRAFPAGHPDIPLDYASVGQPVIVPGTMGTASYVLTGTQKAMEETWGSSCHGAGRVMSRSEALRKTRGEQVRAGLEKIGVIPRSASWKTLAEEAPMAYKDINEVVEVCVKAGIAKKVAKMRPLAVIKG